MRAELRDDVARLAGLVGDEREARWILDEAIERAPAAGRDVTAIARRLAERRAAGEPLQHVLGHWGFWTFDVAVDRRALIPRPETEIVVEVALGELRRVAEQCRAEVAAERRLLVADLGTGSGVIALALATELGAGAAIYATDRSDEALELASENLRRVLPEGPADRVALSAGSWFEALPPELAGRLDLVVSNPPYVSEPEWLGLDPVVRDHDPPLALVAGPTGLECLEHLVTEAPRWLRAGRGLVLELAPHQHDQVLELARAAAYASIEVKPDLTGRPRVLVART